MNNKIIANVDKPFSRHVYGDGDGIKETRRYPVPSSRKFTPTKEVDPNNKLRLELALKELTKGNKGNQSTRKRTKQETASLTSLSKTSNSKKLMKTSETNKFIEIYGTPRERENKDTSRNEAARVIYKYLLLNSWRKSKSKCASLSDLLKRKNKSLMQLNLQIYVLRSLRKSESQRQEYITNSYLEAQNQVVLISEENNLLKNEIQSAKEDSCRREKDFTLNQEKLEQLIEVCKAKDKTINDLTTMCQKLNEKIEIISVEKTERCVQIENLQNKIRIQNENIQNLKTDVENALLTKRSLTNAVEISEKKCKEYIEKLQSQVLLTKSYESKILHYEQEKEMLQKDLRNLEIGLQIAHNDFNNLKTQNESIQLQVRDLSQQIQTEKGNSMKKGLTTTYFALKYLAQLFVTALHNNLKS